jgi:hypothetical protein
MAINLEHYYNRFDASKRYDQHLFRAGYVVQSAEFNEVQSAQQQRLRLVADALFSDGDVVRGAGIVVDSVSGVTQCEAGEIYLAGAVRYAPTGDLAIPVDGEVAVGIYLTETVITELEDPALRDPATGVRNYQEPGAARLRTDTEWGYDGDGRLGEFYPVYRVVDGVLAPKTPPPEIDAILASIAQYDIDSAGGHYIVDGMRVLRVADAAGGEQAYTILEGRARVSGYSVDLATARRVIFDTAADLSTITAEPHVSTADDAQRVNLNNTPVETISQVTITAQKSVTVVHGNYTGAADDLPDETVLELVSVAQSGTTYVADADYRLLGGDIDWSLAGDEPAPGSSYDVVYKYLATVSPTDPDETGFTVTGALTGSLIQVTYAWKLPRWDRLCLNRNGGTVWLKGVARERAPKMPAVPQGLLLLASVYQAWGDETQIINDGVRVTSMGELDSIKSDISSLYDLVAQERLKTDAMLSDPTAKKGIFVDPFLDNDMRDLGIEQDGYIFDGVLTLTIEGAMDYPTLAPETPQTAPYADTLSADISQTARTRSQLINPYQTFDPVPARVTLSPSRDAWVVSTRTTTSVITERVNRQIWAERQGLRRSDWKQVWTTTDWSVSEITIATSSSTSISSVEMPNMRSRAVAFTLRGFAPGETVNQIVFDGINVTASGA